MDGWDGILEDGERILWQGRPDGRPRVTKSELPLTLFGCLFAIFGFGFTIAAIKTGGLWPIGLVHFSIGAFLASGPTLVGPFLRRRTWYTLTSRRVLIATDFPMGGRKLYGAKLTPDTRIKFDGSAPGTIKFDVNSESYIGYTPPNLKPLFYRIDEAPGVFDMIRNIQRGTV